MKNKVYILVIFMLLAEVVTSSAMAIDTDKVRERKIKAAFLYNFINFVQWPEEVSVDDGEPFVIGVVGETTMNREFLNLAKKKIKNKKIVVRQYENFCESAKKLKNSKSKEKWKQGVQLLKKCRVVFISNCESLSSEDRALILKELEGSPILIVGESEDFLESGGIINFLTDEKISFEINFNSAKQNGIQIRSKLLKLAKRVIQDEKARDAKD